MRQLQSAKKKNKIVKSQRQADTDIAIIGMACRFPGANHYMQFWDNLAAGINSIREITPDRWDTNTFYSNDRNAPNKSISKWGGLLDQIDSFDAPFFHISPQEAVAMDPQQRLLLEETWHCIEDAGISLAELQQSKTSVHVGVMSIDYQHHMFDAGHITNSYECVGNYEGILSNRISYFLNLTGKSETIDAACASSLVSIHEARCALLSGESDYAFADGVSVICHPWHYIAFSKSNMLSPEGQCKTFDAEANGYVPGEGVGVVLLCSLQKALEKGYHIYGVIKGSAVKHTGKGKSITAPRVEIERQVVEDALANGHVSPESITYVEAHGTGTSLGDPIEVEALTQAFHTDKKQYCYIGSVKTNIGHLEGAAGIAGVIKVLLMLQHKKIPKILNIKTVNPIIDFENSPFCLAHELTDWKLPKTISHRFAGVSSFGFGGMNAHVVLEEYSVIARSALYDEAIQRLPLPFILSAKSEKSLQALLKCWQEHVGTESFKSQTLENICSTLIQGREVFTYRFGALIENKNDLARAIKDAKQVFLDTEALHKKRSVVLRLHPLSNITYDKFHKVCEQHPILSQIEVSCRKTIGHINLDRKEKRFQRLRSFIILFVLSKALLKSGVHPHYLMGEGIGAFTQLVLSDMLDFNVAIEWLLGKKPAIHLKHPSISFYDAQQKTIIEPYEISAKYCIALINDLKVDTQTSHILFEKYRQLLMHQFTFKNFLHEWDKTLEKYNISIKTALENADKLKKNQRLLLLIILHVCMTKLNKKWNLAEKLIITNNSFKEIVDLLIDQALSQEDVAKFLLAANEATWQSVAAHIQKHQHRINPLKPYILLNQFNKKINAIPDAELWLKALLETSSDSLETQHKNIHHTWYVDIGGNSPLNGKDLQNALPAFLLSLWREGISVDWKLWYAGTNCQKIALPVYPFARERYWIPMNAPTPELTMQSSLHASTEKSDLLDNKNPLLEKVTAQLISMSSKIFRIEIDKINPEQELNAYGIDSVGATELTMDLDEYYGLDLTPAILFEHNTLKSFAEYLILHYQSAITARHKINIPKSIPEPSPQTVNGQNYQQALQHAEDIAIIGMSGVFPGSPDLDMFWENMLQGKDLITEVPKDRWDENKTKVKWGGFIDGIDKFDATFFGISPREAELMDPQQRIFLETAWKVIEDSGYTVDHLAKIKTGVFVGVATNDYHGLLQMHGETSAHVPTGVFYSILSNRVSFLFNFTGPSETIDTACSSSLVAIHNAINAIQTGDCDIAIAGGVNALLSPNTFIEFSNAGMLSEDGRCKTFDKSANGYVRGEGAGAILLKPLKKALQDRDRIYGVIKGTAVNHGGRVNSLTVPNPNAQADVIITACERAKVDVGTISYIEAHGTGTALGDPIEINGLKKAFHTLQEKHGKNNSHTHYCGLGSVKNSIGHLEGAAGIAGVINVLLAMQREKIPSNLHFKELNPYIEIKDSPFYIVEKTQEWERLKDQQGKDIPRLAGVSSFGFGGTNAHIIIEEAPQTVPVEHANKPFYLVTLSAKTEALLKQKMVDLEKFLAKESGSSLEDISYTLNVGRSHFNKRCAMVISSFSELQETLKNIIANQIPTHAFINLAGTEKPRDLAIFKKVFKQIMQEMSQVEKLSANEYLDNLLALANFYLEGYDLDWELLHQGESKQKISLPTYPFAKEHYWFDGHLSEEHTISSVGNKKIVLRESQNQPDKDTVQAKLLKLVGDLLYLPTDNIFSNQPFSELGLDSILVVELTKKINIEFGLDFAATRLYDYATLEKLANHIADFINENNTNLPDKIELKQSLNLPLPIKKLSHETKKDIAIIGYSGRFPGANNVEEFWENVASSKSSITEAQRWPLESFYDENPDMLNKSYSKWGGFLTGIDQFDPLFFNIAPTEAEQMDPQQRLFLEECWKTIEMAGYNADVLSGTKCGVFVGVGASDYNEQSETVAPLNAQSLMGNAASILSARIAYFLNLKGPCIAIDTACSSSLVAIHQACQSLWEGESEIALAGGVCVLTTPKMHIMTSKAGMLSADGKCKTFDNSADGFVPAEGVGVVLLKPLAKAIEDNDYIYGVIKGSGINQDGKTNGITAPSVNSQIALEQDVYRHFSIDPKDITYVETHGTGTKLGDPIEVEALTEAFKVFTDKKQYCGIGSVKTNIGHALAAAGMASVIKILLCLQHKKIVPTLNFNQENEHIHFKESPFYVNKELKNWETAANVPRLAAVSSFGFSGTNAHLVIEEAPYQEIKEISVKPYYLLTLSAKTESSLHQRVDDLIHWLKNKNNNSQIPLSAIAYTLNMGRSHFNYRLSLVVDSIEELKGQFEKIKTKQKSKDYFLGIVDKEKDDENMYNKTLDGIIEELKSIGYKDTIRYRKNLRALANLYVKGYDLDWELLHRDESKKRIALPTYPFSKKNFWIKAVEEKNKPDQIKNHFILNNPIQKIGDHYQHCYTFDPNNILLKHHCVLGTYIFPTDSWIELIYTAGMRYFKSIHLSIEQLYILSPLIGSEVYLTHVEQDIVPLENEIQVSIKSYSELNNKDKIENISCTVSLSKDVPPVIDIHEIIDHTWESLDVRRLFNNGSSQLGPFFQSIKAVYIKEKNAVGKLKLSESAKAYRHQFHLHPSIVDGALIVVLALAGKLMPLNANEVYVPTYIENVEIYSELIDDEYTVVVEAIKIHPEFQRFNVYLLNKFDQVVLYLRELDERKVSRDNIEAVAKKTEMLTNLSEKTGLKTLSTGESSLPQLLEKKLMDIITAVLSIDAAEFYNDRGFSEQGMDSILGTEIIHKINKTFYLTLKGTVLYEQPTLKKLTAFLVQNYADQLQKQLGTVIQENELPEKAGVLHESSASFKKLNLNQIEASKKVTQSLKSNTNSYSNSDIAIIGMAGKFPESDTLEELWEHIKQGSYLLKPVPDDHWNYIPFYQPGEPVPGKIYARNGGFVRDVDKFDTFFFNISPREAEMMDPQLRGLLQVAWAALEDAGCSASIKGTCAGVYIGNCFNDYHDLLKQSPYVDYQFAGLNNANSALANRLSYSLDITGPSLTLDTACSSSLVALHLACQALQKGECSLALVGGANLSLSPGKYLTFCSMNAFSKHDEINPFDENADGYLPGEGIAILLLKPLAQALQDKDQIHGIIKGSAVNTAGKSSGPTVPNPDQEAQVIIDAWKAANINPETIGYFEGHGTGTKIGDPLEINAIDKAFSSFTKKKQFCALGTIKANIGHTEAAAGIAGVIKVLLQMRYDTIPILPKLKNINSMITLEDSSLFINREAKPWTKHSDHPRRGVVSSFGMGGTYAHVVLEEGPIINDSSQQIIKPAYIITLSAKTAASLKQQMEDLREWLTTHLQESSIKNISLENMSYMLNAGRNHFEKRCALVISSLEELKDKLSQLQKEKTVAGCFQCEVVKKPEDAAIYKKVLASSLEELKTQSSAVKYRENLEALANLYVKGYDLDWELLHQGETKQKISLPTYPFAKERYWIPENESTVTKNTFQAIASLHPLIDSNTSTLSEQRFTKLLTGKEFYLTDHRVNNIPVLPGVAYLEMVRVAGQLANPDQKVKALKNITWSVPIQIQGEAVSTCISLYLDEKAAAVSFEVTTEDTLHAQGKIIYGDASVKTDETLDISSIQSRCATTKSKDEIYASFNNIGLNYGASFQGIETLWVGGKEALAKIVLPSHLVSSREDYHLHPSLFDAVLQTTIGLSANDSTLYLPFSLAELTLISPLPETVYAYVTRRDSAEHSVVKYDIQVTDAEGKIVAEIEEFTVRALTQDERGIYYYRQLWKQSEGTKTEKPLPHVLYRATGDVNKDYDALLKLCQELIEAKAKEVQQLICVTNPSVYYASALSGFLKTLHLEYPKIIGRVIHIQDENELSYEFSTSEAEVRYDEHHQRWIKTYEEAPLENAVDSVLIKSGGVYWITGGAGGLGLIFAKYLAKVYQAKLILTGRSKLTESQKAAIAECEKLGAEVIYLRGNISKKEDVKLIFTNIKSRFGQLNGIIHSAGTLRDAFILKKTVEESRTVLDPKIQGIKNIDTVTKNEKLDFFVMFSSIASVFGNVGQCDYAYANGFMDDYAEYREELRKKNQRNGKTVSINWPLWREGGMKVDEASERWIRDTLGAESLSTDAGIQAFHAALTQSFCQEIVCSGQKRKFAQHIKQLIDTRPTISETVLSELTVDQEKLLEKVQANAVNMISDLLKIKPEVLDVDAEFSEYGMDSISFTTLANQINQRYQLELTPAILFEYKTLSEFSRYLIENHLSTVLKVHVDAKTREVSQIKQTILPTEISRNRKRYLQTQSVLPVKQEKDDIAIIGMNGIFPGSDNVDIFWKHLENQDDLISEIPKDRWDWEKYYGEHKTKVKWGGFIKGIDEFDAAFFNISPREAELMDPQQRLFLQTVWKTIEDSGYKIEDLAKIKTGLFVGVSTNDYAELLQKINETSAYMPTGTGHCVLANRVSYLLNLSGPSEAIDTACSSSLVAVHQAVIAIQNGDCEIAIAGGVSALLAPTTYLAFSKAGMLSEDGRCKTFDKSADGYVRGEGVGAILLKPLSKALADGDNIYGVIKGTAVNHGGHVSSLTVPNPNAQAELIVTACERGNISVDSISYIETHGTGTSLGDPIEVNGLKKAFQELAQKQHKDKLSNYYCGLGTVKTNIGHLEAAAGIAGVIKVLLALRYKKLPGNVNFKELNPYIEIKDSPFYILEQTKDWLVGNGKPRIAGISSFGFGGANAHVVIAESPQTLFAQHANKPYYLITLSAKTEQSLYQQIDDLIHWLKNENNNSQIPLSTIAYTLNVGRSHFNYRLSLVVDSLEGLNGQLEKVKAKQKSKDYCLGMANKEIDDQAIYQEVFETTFDKLIKADLSDRSAYKKHLRALANLYVKGYDLDWELLHQGEAKQKISLPTYPFIKNRYWFDSYEEKNTLIDNDLPYEGKKVTLEIVHDHIAIIKMQDVEHSNLFTKELLHGLKAKFKEAGQNDQVKVIILTGYENIFSMGGDESELTAIANGEGNFTDMPFIYKGLLECRVPVISAIQGHAHGGGLALGLYADIVILSEENTYCASFMKYGFTPGLGATFILKEKLGAVASEMMLTARLFTGLELKNRASGVLIKPQADVLKEAISIAMNLSEKPLPALIALKEDMAKKILDQLPTVIQHELAMHQLTFSTEEVKKRIHTVFHPDQPLSANTKNMELSPKHNNESIQNEFIQILVKKTHRSAKDISIDASFNGLGIDSIATIEIIREVNQLWGLNLEVANLYAYPTIRKLVPFIVEKINEKQSVYSDVNQNIPLKNEVSHKIALTAVATEPESKITDVTSNVSSRSSTQETDIAVIGLSGRFPDAQNIKEFWNNIAKGANSIKTIPKERWDAEYYYDSNPDAENKTNNRVGAFIKDVTEFDPLFFNISPKEAELMDPQQRIFLEEAWKAIEDAGYAPNTISGMKCGVFVGACVSDYTDLLAEVGLQNSAHALTGLSPAILAARISYFLNLKGPSLVIDTACSSSLVAIHEACESILSGQSDIALAGGVALMFTPKMHILTSKAGMLSQTEQGRVFDQLSDGIVLGEGVGVVVLKRLSQAIRDHDFIHGIIKASGINQDGATSGITAPNPESQTALEIDVYERAKINPETITYIEAHGTGTKLGDPIEISALTKAFRHFTDKKNYCAVGSVKANIGHTTMAAGVAGVIKTLLALKHKQIAPHSNFTQLNEHIQLENSPFYVTTELKDWKVDNMPRRAAVSSFGFSGTNAHIVIEEVPEQELKELNSKPYYLLTLSAKSENSLKQRINDLNEWLNKEENREIPLSAIAHTLNVGRGHFEKRCALVVDTLDSLREKLLQLQANKMISGCFRGDAKKPDDAAVYAKVLESTCKELKTNQHLDKIQYKNNLESLANLYVKSYELDWELLHYGESKQKVSLPSYPFARERYWFDGHLAREHNDFPVNNKKIVLRGSQNQPEKELMSGSDKLANLTLKRLSSSATLVSASTQSGVSKKILIDKDTVQIKLTKLVGDALYLSTDQISPNKSFSELGLDSVIGVELTRKINNEFGFDITATKLYDYSTIEALAIYITDAVNENNKNLPDEIELKQPLNMTDEFVEPIEPTKQTIKRNRYLPAVLPLSFGEQRFWFIDQLNIDREVYNLPICLRLEGPLSISTLENAIQGIMNRHEILRTVYIQSNEQLTRKIYSALRIPFSFYDLRSVDQNEQAKEQKSILHSAAQKPFNLNEAPLFRVGLIQLASNTYIFYLIFHHIIVDVWSIGILAREIAAFYNSELSGEPVNLLTLPIQYSDYAVWQHDYLHEENEVLQKQLNYWHKQLENAPRLSELGIGNTKSVIPNLSGEQVRFVIPRELKEKLQQLAKESQSTLFMVLFSAFGILLYRYSHQNDIVIGSTIANRSQHKIEGLVGFLVNTLALRIKLSDSQTFQSLLEQTKEIALNAYENQDIPFEKLVDHLKVSRSLTHNPLFQIMFNYLKIEEIAEVLSLKDITVNEELLDNEKTKFDLTMEIYETATDLKFNVKYITQLFHRDAIDRLIKHWMILLNGIVSNPNARILELPLLEEQEKHHLVFDWNRTETDYPKDKTIAQLFEEQVERTPNQIAVIFEGQSLSYQELNERSNALAHLLRARYLEIHGKALEKDTLVGLYLERSIEAIVGILGIIKAGAAYVPFDLACPQKRLQFMLEDSQVALIVSQSTLEHHFSSFENHLVFIDDKNNENYSKENPASISTPHDLAYVIYTSGTTGNPKGVMIEHQSVVNFSKWFFEFSGGQLGQRIDLSGNMSFDMSVANTIMPLIFGLPIVICAEDIKKDARQYLTHLVKHRVNFIKLTPSYFKVLLDEVRSQHIDLPDLQIIILGGESLRSIDCAHWLEIYPAHTLFNECGPTEATVAATQYKITHINKNNSNEIVPIGKPGSNMSCYIYGPNFAPIPPGSIGELYIGGVGVARGYLNRPELTKERFVHDPYSKTRLYKTGDLCRWLADGNIEYIGRIDHQVKIRGFRIELDEVEAALKKHQALKDVVVIAREDVPGHKQLVAYYIKSPEVLMPSNSELVEYMKRYLPEYMIPSAFVAMDKFPLTANGKLDREALPAAELFTKNSNYASPRDALELAMVHVWSDVLKHANFSIKDNFFEIGGHSLLAIALSSALRQELKIEIPVAAIFSYPTIEAMTELVRHQKIDILNSHIVPIKTLGNKEPLFIIHPVGGNVMCYLELSKHLDCDRPIYGVQQVQIPATGSNHTIELMAKRYVNAIHDIQARGPYYLAGWSLGGVIAVEMAHQIEQSDDEVRFLGLIDSYPDTKKISAKFGNSEILLAFAEDLGGRYGKELTIDKNKFYQLDYEQQLNYLFERAKAHHLLAPHASINEINSLVNQCRHNSNAAAAHHVHPVNCPIIAFQADETVKSMQLLLNPWEDYTQKTSQAYKLKGNHYSILNSNKVKILAKKMQDHLNN